jgi:hypothetical protein
MTIRYWFSGPRILNGLVRPGISFTANDLRPKAPARAPARITSAPIFVLSRSDGAVFLGMDGAEAAPDGVDLSDELTMPVMFHFDSEGTARAALAGARLRLAKSAAGADGWLRGVTAGQVAAAIKNEARGLSYEFEAIHPQVGAEPPQPEPRRDSAERESD